MGSASMSDLSANLGSPLPMLARMPVSAIGCLYAISNLSSWDLHHQQHREHHHHLTQS